VPALGKASNSCFLCFEVGSVRARTSWTDGMSADEDFEEPQANCGFLWNQEFATHR
jgi:hypothetical protein